VNERRILDTFTDADGIPVQEYFAAFMIERGYTHLTVPARDRTERNVDFMGWIQDRWQELEARHGFTNLERGLHRKDMLDYLEDRALDHVARNVVEAA
jgi:hypothetical protein